MNNLAMHSLVLLSCAALLGGCALSPAGVRWHAPPPAIQGSNDAQGNPLSVPGAGMGVGSGNPNPPGAAGMGPKPSR